MRAKVKTTIIDTGQEYLLLVAKMNLKGILVNTSKMLKPNTQLMLELKLNEEDPIMLKGYVHKVSAETANKKGMVIAFSNPSEESKQRIQRFIDDSKEISAEVKAEVEDEVEKKKSKWTLRKKKDAESETETKKSLIIEKKVEAAQKPIEQPKTMIVGDDDLPSMSLSSPDNSKELNIATMDEEALHANNPGFSGDTRHAMVSPRDSQKKKLEKKSSRLSTIYKAFGFVVAVIVLVLAAKPALQIMDQKFGKKFLTPSASNSTKPSGTTPSVTTPTGGTTVVAGTLDSVQVDDQGGFLKISLLGTGNFANNKIVKLTEPGRINIELEEIADYKTQITTAVNNNPISKIDVSKNATKVIVDIFYTGKEPPNYEAKVYPNSMDIFIYR